ncbi:MAG: hypothetical protein MMC33_003108 [Icmadophila ericetorum]|nr:hypothetical protein [Icmadophila ericetorum]
MKKTWRNPIAFTPLPVTIITSFTYAALLIALLVTHVVVPPAPSNDSPVAGINISEAWLDLQTLSNGYHPYNSHRNDEIRNWLLLRINSILQENGADYTSPKLGNESLIRRADPFVYVFNDMTSDVTSSTSFFGSAGLSVYFEGTNIIIYIRGTEDDQRNWWEYHHEKPQGKGGVLVNSHYDSVSTGFGATDDGVGVITVLQLVKYFTAAGNQPKKGVVALLNNGEEDFLNGARAFTQHPLSRFVHTFLNLEGAGAGGRATLFRTTDTEVTRAYQRSEYPFGTVISGDAFNRGLIRSQTDYVVFESDLGLRGLDLAFMEPRARYHTDQDDARHTSKDSLWHMLSAALSTMKSLTDDTSDIFDGKNSNKGKAQNGIGSESVWFDLFGRAFAVFQLHTLFAISITLLVVAPITLMVIGGILYKVDKLYLFSSSKHHHHPEGDDTVSLYGWRGFFRYPIIFTVASAVVIGLALLINKQNQFIVHSSPYSVWSMMLSAWLLVVWFFSRAQDFVRPTAFHRAYALLWMFLGTWAILVAVTVLEERFKIAGGYSMVLYFAAIFLATMIAFLELFGLPRKSEYAEEIEEYSRPTTGRRSGSISSAQLLAPSADEAARQSREDDEEEPTERTSLMRGKNTTFANYTSPERNRDEEPEDEEETLSDSKQQKVYGYEQPWSYSLPTWTWLLQFLFLAPIATIFIGQVGLLFTSATHQTLGDGNRAITVYILIGVCSILILAPLGPFMHRYTYHIPTFLLCVFAGTLIYNLTAFPFSANARWKFYFIQQVDLDTGLNTASLSGVGRPYMEETIYSLPSAAGQKVDCIKSNVRTGLLQCSWEGLPPRVVPTDLTQPSIPPLYNYVSWLTLNVSRAPGTNTALIHLWGANTRSCKLQFNSPISDFRVLGAHDDPRYKRVSDEGSNEIRLWRRTWEKPWDVEVHWDASEGKGIGEDGLDGKVICMWNGEGMEGTIPALDEVRRFAPEWVAVSKLADGLVEGSKRFLI